MALAEETSTFRLKGEKEMWLLKFFTKSKTVIGNISAGAVVTILSLLGINIPAEIVAAALILLNFILRAITKDAIADK